MNKQRINQEISVDQMILIDETGKPYGKVSYDQAMLLASDRDLDVVEVKSSNGPSDLAICKIMDYGKKLYQQQKQANKHKVKQKAPELKEIKLSTRIDEHDFQTKVKRAKEFFEKGDKVRVFIRLKGREMMFKDKVQETIERFKNECQGKYEQEIKRLGSQFSTIITKV